MESSFLSKFAFSYRRAREIQFCSNWFNFQVGVGIGDIEDALMLLPSSIMRSHIMETR